MRKERKLLMLHLSDQGKSSLNVLPTLFGSELKCFL